METAVRTTGLLTAGRNPGGRTDPVRQLLTTGGNNATSEEQVPPVAGVWLRPSPPGGCFLPLALPRGTVSHRHRWNRTGRQASRRAGSLTPPRRVGRQVIPPAVLECGRATPPRPS